MWLRLMRQWMIGAAVTMAVPSDGFATPSPVDDTARCEGETARQEVAMERREWERTEPSMAEVMADPIIQAMMKSDGVSPASVQNLAGHVRRAKDNRHGPRRV